MITHTIYHIPGRKVGCTKNLQSRINEYLKHEGVVPNVEVLEELHDKTDQEAGDIEWIWADKFGYNRGRHYSITIAASIAGGRRANSVFSEEEIHARGVRGGLGRYRNYPPEQISEWSRRAGLIGGRAAANKGVLGCQVRTSCPHCGLESSLAILHRWHFDHCWKKPAKMIRRR